MSLFNASEIFQFAIRIEENGEKFYRSSLENTDDENVKNLFTYLADQEVEHKKIFENMVSRIENYEPPESYPDEYFTYLRAYADRIVFDEESLEKELSEVKDMLSTINFAIQIELDSILYYQEIKIWVPESHRNLIEKIITEERKHFLDLSNIKKTIK